MRPTVFINALREENKGAAILTQAGAVNAKDDGALVRIVDSSVFSEIPGSPFSYGVSEAVRSAFARFGPLESDVRHARQGLATAADFRFVRLWWEANPLEVVTGVPGTSLDALRSQTRQGRSWVPFAKGGAYLPLYADLHLVVYWRDEGQAVKDYICIRYPYLDGKWEWVAKNTEFYFRSGLTWPRRTSSGFSPRCLPAGTIFADKGPAILSDRPAALLGVVASASFNALVGVQIADTPVSRSYEVGVIQRTPVPSMSAVDFSRLSSLAMGAVAELQRVDMAYEMSHLFTAPSLVIDNARNLERAHAIWTEAIRQSQERVALTQEDIDRQCLKLYGFSEEDIATSQALPAASGEGNQEEPEDDTSDDVVSAVDLRSEVFSLVSYSVGCAFGRWDIRCATGEKTFPELPDPFAPLPVCSPGMLQGEDGLPLTATPPGYPLRINWNGILVDEPHHTDDIVGRTREVLHLLWPATSDGIEAEMCDSLGVKDLRDYFRKPGSGGFWMDHVHMYSKSHRKAPIYWLLQSSHKNYGIWLYYQRLDSDLLFKVLQNYVEPKLKLEQNHETEASHKLSAGGLSVSETRQAQKDLEKQQDLVADIRDFRDTLKKAAGLRLTPDLDDGVILNIAPLRDLVPWSEASKYWDELQAGKYPWSSIGKQLEQKRMV